MVKRKRERATRKRKSFYFANRRLYYSRILKDEETRLNLKYQKPLRRRIVITTRKIKKLPKRERVPAPEKLPVKRIRKQIAYSFKIKEKEDRYAVGFISIQAITINPEITEKGLSIAVQEIKRNLEQNYGLDFSIYNVSYKAPELIALAPKEEKELNDYRVHIQVTLYKKGASPQGIWFIR